MLSAMAAAGKTLAASASSASSPSSASSAGPPAEAGQPPAKRQRPGSSDAEVVRFRRLDPASFFGPEATCDYQGEVFLGAKVATIQWRVEDFEQQKLRAQGAPIDGPKFGLREPWQVFCHPDGKCFNQPSGGPPGVFLRYLGLHERVPAYATIEKLVDGKFCVPENNSRDAPFVVLFGRSEIDEWGVCKDFGLFDDSFAQNLDKGALVLRARVMWIEPRVGSLLPFEAIERGAAPKHSLTGCEDSLWNDMARLWRSRLVSSGTGPSGGPALPVAICRGDDDSEVRLPADIVITCGTQRFEADRCVLAARSSYFNAMLSSYREAGQTEINMPDVSPQALSWILHWIYTDEAPQPQSKEQAEELLVAASRLAISGLQESASDYLKDNCLVVDSALSLLRLADTHGALSLRKEALQTVGVHYDSIKKTAEWTETLRSNLNPALLSDMMQAISDACFFHGRASIKL